MGTHNCSGSRNGILSVVGTGPGNLDYLIPAARKELEKADVVVGYRTYLDLIGELIEGKETFSSAMMQEVDRVGQAIDMAEQGRHVALVSGGDPGIYAMSGSSDSRRAPRTRWPGCETARWKSGWWPASQR